MPVINHIFRNLEMTDRYIFLMIDTFLLYNDNKCILDKICHVEYYILDEEREYEDLNQNG